MRPLRMRRHASSSIQVNDVVLAPRRIPRRFGPTSGNSNRLPAVVAGDSAGRKAPTIPRGRDQAGTGGPSWVASIVNAITAASSYWASTTIIVTWDDWGGWYDHVSPSKVINDGKSWGSGYVYGFRRALDY